MASVEERKVLVIDLFRGDDECLMFLGMIYPSVAMRLKYKYFSPASTNGIEHWRHKMQERFRKSPHPAIGAHPVKNFFCNSYFFRNPNLTSEENNF